MNQAQVLRDKRLVISLHNGTNLCTCMEVLKFVCSISFDQVIIFKTVLFPYSKEMVLSKYVVYFLIKDIMKYKFWSFGTFLRSFDGCNWLLYEN